MGDICLSLPEVVSTLDFRLFRSVDLTLLPSAHPSQSRFDVDNAFLISTQLTNNNSNNNGWLAKRTLRVLQRLRSLHHFLHHSVLHVWQECGSSRRELHLVWIVVSLWNSCSHNWVNAPCKDARVKGHRRVDVDGRCADALMSILRFGSNCGGAETRTGQRLHGQRIKLNRGRMKPAV